MIFTNVNFPFICSNIQATSLYGVYISQFVILVIRSHQ